MAGPYYTRSNSLTFAASKLGQKVTVPTNPYGGQCAAWVSYFIRWLFNNEKNLDYTNAIDMLKTAQRMGLQVEYFNGSNYNWSPGDIWVTRTTGHQFGHTGIFTSVGRTFTTLEQNVDGNWDALYNGGWVRAKTRTLYPSSEVTYTDINEIQYMVGWIKVPFKTDSSSEQTTNNDLFKKGGSMYGSYFFSVKEGDELFGKGTLYFYNAATNTVNGLKHIDEAKAISTKYKNDFGEDPKSVVYTRSAPWHMRLFEGMKTQVNYQGNQDAEIVKLVQALPKESSIKTLLDRVEELKTESIPTEQKEFDIVNHKKFKLAVNANIRTTPSTKGEKIGILAAGTEVTITGSALNDGWYWVQFNHNGKEAYVVSKKQGGDITGTLL